MSKKLLLLLLCGSHIMASIVQEVGQENKTLKNEIVSAYTVEKAFWGISPNTYTCNENGARICWVSDRRTYAITMNRHFRKHELVVIRNKGGELILTKSTSWNGLTKEKTPQVIKNEVLTMMKLLEHLN